MALSPTGAIGVTSSSATWSLVDRMFSYAGGCCDKSTRLNVYTQIVDGSLRCGADRLDPICLPLFTNREEAAEVWTSDP